MQSSKRQLELDFVRGIAILMVLHFHFWTGSLFALRFPMPLANFGWAGVDLFFVLSGFLVGGLLLKEWKNSGGVNAIRFLKRRGFKIWPAYYFYFLVEVLVHKHPLKTFFWPNLLNYQNYVRTPLSQTWSLAVEEHFYLLLSAVVWWCSSKKLRIGRFLAGSVAVALTVAILRTYFALTGQPYFFQTHTRIDALLLGVMLAVLFHFYNDYFLKLQRRVLILSLVLSVSIFVLLVDPQFSENGVQIFAAEIGGASLFLLLYRPRAASHGRLYRTVAGIGVYSYGIYLWHLSVRSPLELLLSYGPNEVRYLRYPLGVLLALVLGYVMTKLIEFPFLHLRERLVPTVESYELSAGTNHVEQQIVQEEGVPQPAFAPRS